MQSSIFENTTVSSDTNLIAYGIAVSISLEIVPWNRIFRSPVSAIISIISLCPDFRTSD